MGGASGCELKCLNHDKGGCLRLPAYGMMARYIVAVSRMIGLLWQSLLDEELCL